MDRRRFPTAVACSTLSGSAVLMMFNYFTCRSRGVEPDFALFKERSAPARFKPVLP